MADYPMETSSLVTTGGQPSRNAKQHVSYDESDIDNNGNVKKNRESGTKKSGVVLSSTSTTISSFIDGAGARAGAGAELTTSTTVFDGSELTNKKLDEVIMALEGTFDPIPSTGGCQYVGVRKTTGSSTFNAQIRLFGKKMNKCEFKTTKEAGIWYAKAKYVRENWRAVESKPLDPNSKVGQKNNAKKGVVINPDDYSIVTTLSQLEDPNYKHKHENHTQGLSYDQLRDTDVLIGVGTLATEDDVTVAFRNELTEKFGSKPISITDPNLINYVNELFTKRKIRLMEEYKDDDGNNVWGSHGGEDKIIRYILQYVRSSSKRKRAKSGMKKDFDESEEEDEHEEDDEKEDY